MSDSEIMNTINDLVDELTLDEENDDADSREIDYPEDEGEEEEEKEEETDLDTSSMDMSDSSSDIEDEENDAEELPFPNLTIRIPTAEAEAESSHSPLYSPGTPETEGIPGDLAEDLAAEAHALETEEEAFGEVSEEKIETKQEEKTPIVEEEEPDSCGVCYVELTDKNMVNTNCNHKFCNKCFFKWMKVQARCPMCRKHFRTDVDLTDEELARENSENYQEYINTLERYVDTKQMSDFWIKKVYELKMERLQLMRCQISLKEQIDQTRAYNDGVTAAMYHKNMDEIPPAIIARYEVNKRLPDYLYGYRNGLKSERERIQRDENINESVKQRKKKKEKKKEKKKSKKRQADLFCFGFNTENKVLKTSVGQKQHEPIEFSFEFVPRDPNKPLPVFSFN